MLLRRAFDSSSTRGWHRNTMAERTLNFSSPSNKLTPGMAFKQVTLSDYVSRDDKLAGLCRGRRVLHLGCVGFTDCAVEDKVSLARQSLHQRLSEVADCVGTDL